jgi:hypothetical protein
MQIPPIRKEDGKWARNDERKAERFANHLEKTFQSHRQQEGEITWKATMQEGDEITPGTPQEVNEEIKENVSPKKAPGFDSITGEILKQLPRKAVVKLTKLISAAFRLKYVPRLWKVAEVVMIPKPGKPPKTSHWPISLLPITSKLFEKMLLKNCNQLLKENS